jgi:hypothetical protein
MDEDVFLKVLKKTSKWQLALSFINWVVEQPPA